MPRGGVVRPRRRRRTEAKRSVLGDVVLGDVVLGDARRRRRALRRHATVLGASGRGRGRGRGRENARWWWNDDVIRDRVSRAASSTRRRGESLRRARFRGRGRSCLRKYRRIVLSRTRPRGWTRAGRGPPRRSRGARRMFRSVWWASSARSRARAHLLAVVEDDEFFGGGTKGKERKGNDGASFGASFGAHGVGAFTLGENRAVAACANTLVVRTHLARRSSEGGRAFFSGQGGREGGRALRRLTRACASLLRALRARDERRAFAPPGLWLAPASNAPLISPRAPPPRSPRASRIRTWILTRTRRFSRSVRTRFLSNTARGCFDNSSGTIARAPGTRRSLGPWTRTNTSASARARG